MSQEPIITRLTRRIVVLCVAAASILLLPISQVLASNYPARPIRVIVAVAPGGVGDLFIRALGERLSPILKQPIVIENKPGGAFNIASRTCAESAPDGYTVCLLPGEPLTYNQFLYKDIGYDPVASFAPITNLFFITQVLAINSSLGVKDVAGLAVLAKSKPGTLSYSAPGLSQALFVEDFKKKNGADIVWVPFKGGGDAMTGLLSGSVPIVFIGLGNVLGSIEAGKATPLVTDSDQRSPLIPNVPTLKEIGYGGDITRSYFGLVAPAKTPSQIVNALSEAIRSVFKDKDFVHNQLIAKGLDPAANSPAEFEAFLKNDRRAAEQVAKASGRKIE